MGGGSDARQKRTPLSFPVPLPISFLTNCALPQSHSRAISPFPSFVSHTANAHASPASLSGPRFDEAPAKRQRVDAGGGSSYIGIWGAVPLFQATHANVIERLRGRITYEPSLSPPSIPITRLQRKSGVGDLQVSLENEERLLVPVQPQEVSPLQRQKQALKSSEQQQLLPQARRGTRQFAVTAEVLQSIPIWRRHPESISALLKAAAEVAAARQRRLAAGEPVKADSMLDGGPFTSATIHWEARRQALCVKAHTPAGRCACRYFPVNRLSPSRGDASRRASDGPSTARKRGPSHAGEKPLVVCPKRVLFAAYVFFLQLPLLPPGSSQRAPREIHPGPALTLPAGTLTANSCREIKGETQGGPEALPRGLYCGTTTETANRQSAAAAARRDSVHAECEGGGFRLAAEALAAAAVAVGCLSASAPLTEQHRQLPQDNGQQQAARLAATVALLRWSSQPVDADPSPRCNSASIGRPDQLRLSQSQQPQGQQQRGGQPQQHDEQSFVSLEPQATLLRDGGSQAEGEARAVCTLGNSRTPNVCAEEALRCRCPQCHQQQQQQEEQMAPSGGRSPYAYLSRAAFAAAATVATENMLQELENLVPLNVGQTTAERRLLLLRISSEGASSKWRSSSAEERPLDSGSPTLLLTQQQQQEYQEQELSPPATAARGETTLPRLLQEQETRLLELQLLRPASAAYGAQLLSLALRRPTRGPLSVCSAAAPTQQAAAFLSQHLRPAVSSLMLLPSVTETIAAATSPGILVASAASAAAAVVDTPRRGSGSVKAASRQPPRIRATSLRRILSEGPVDCSDSCNNSKSRRMSWFEALFLSPQSSSALPVESCAANLFAATQFETAAAKRTMGTAAEALHLLALLVPPVGGPSLQQDRLEVLTLERAAFPFHPYVSFLMQGDSHVVPQSIGSLYLALPQPSGTIASQLRKHLVACGRPFILELLTSRSDGDSAAPTCEADSATTVSTRFALAAASAANSFRRQLRIVEAAAEALCCSEEEVASASDVMTLRPLLQYVSARMHCFQCGNSCSQVHLCSKCAAALDAAAQAQNTAGSGTLSSTADLDKRVFSFLSEVLLSFLKTWELEEDEALSSATEKDARAGLWVQATPFVAHVVRGVPLMARHQLHRLAAPTDSPNVAGDSKGAAAAPVSVSASGTSSSRRFASNSASTITGADNGSLALPQQACVNSLPAGMEAPPGCASLPAGAIEGTKATSPLASSFFSFSRASEPVTAGPRIQFASSEEEDPVPWKSIDLFAWSLLDENGASPELSLHLRRSKTLNRKRAPARQFLGESPASRTSETTGACTDEAPSPASATIAAAVAPAGNTREARPAWQPCDFAGPPLHGDSSARVLAAVWQASSCRTLDLAVAEAQRRRISPFTGLLIEECGCIPEAADLQLRRNELSSACEAMERLKTAQLYESTCKAAQLAARQKHLRVAKSAVHGWGVFAAEPIRRGEFIVEYAGNAVAEAKANFLEEQYVQSMGGSTYFFKLRDGSIVDATTCGAATRFINHSCAPNCCTVDILDEDDEAGGSHVGLLALRDIEAGEELSYNYSSGKSTELGYVPESPAAL
ncbi:hypothetical protein Emed_006196 [Eimeria media]